MDQQPLHEIERAWRAMNTDVVAIVNAPPGLVAAGERALSEVEQLFHDVEAALSRFRETSELSALNRAAGAPFNATPLLIGVVEAALEAARVTDGAFDPTILGVLVAAGYDRSFEQLVEPGPEPASTAATSRWSWRDVQIDHVAGTIELPAGCGLDLGGIGKGWTVDRAAERLAPFGSFAVDAGGDMSAGDSDRDGGPWTVGVENPLDPGQDLLELAVRDRAVATSTVARRRWQQAGAARHHLIDPRTGQPSDSGVLSVTVVADSVARAEVLAKAALILGPEDGRRLLDAQPDVEGLLVLENGSRIVSRGFARYVAS
ncbi:MAG: FAD:protein transferase [Chloroflexota bacterium]|nr:FAD:protein transferase [Chloroflexota bacterium]